MERSDANSIMIYYGAIPEMLSALHRQKIEIETKYYDGNHALNADGMPHGNTAGNPTESMALRAADEDAFCIINNIAARISTLETDRLIIKDALSCLCRRYQEVLIYKYVDRHSWAQVGDRMFASDSTVRYWKDKALDKLASILEEDSETIDELVKRAGRART